jgi:hypothetical protein
MSSPHGPPPLILKSTSPMTHGNNGTSSSFVMSNPLYNPPSKDASSHHWAPYSNFLDIPEQIFAQQLTKMDCVRLPDSSSLISRSLFALELHMEFVFNDITPFCCIFYLLIVTNREFSCHISLTIYGRYVIYIIFDPLSVVVSQQSYILSSIKLAVISIMNDPTSPDKSDIHFFSNFFAFSGII